MDAIIAAFSQVFLVYPAVDTGSAGAVLGGRRVMTDLGYIGLTILVFGVLYLIVKGIETFER
jgi:hypothetical protein